MLTTESFKKCVFFNENCVFLRVYVGRPSFFCKKCKVGIANINNFL